MGQRKQRISTRTVELGLSFHPCLPPSQVVCRITSLAVGGRKSGVGLACAQGRGPQAWVKNIEILTLEVRQLEAQAGLLASHRLEPRPGLASSLPPCIGAIFCWEIGPSGKGFPPSTITPNSSLSEPLVLCGKRRKGREGGSPTPRAPCSPSPRAEHTPISDSSGRGLQLRAKP